MALGRTSIKRASNIRSTTERPTSFAGEMKLNAHERGGSGSTTNVNNFREDDFSIVHGASFSMVLDVGNWDASRMTNTPGQSGDPRSPFYDNLLAGWANDETFPLLFSREEILEHEAFRIVLTPLEESGKDGQ